MPEVTRCIVCEDPSFTEMLDSVESIKLTMFPDLPLSAALRQLHEQLHQYSIKNVPADLSTTSAVEEMKNKLSAIMMTSEEAGGKLSPTHSLTYSLTRSLTHSLTFLSSLVENPELTAPLSQAQVILNGLNNLFDACEQCTLNMTEIVEDIDVTTEWRSVDLLKQTEEIMVCYMSQNNMIILALLHTICCTKMVLSLPPSLPPSLSLSLSLTLSHSFSLSLSPSLPPSLSLPSSLPFSLPPSLPLSVHYSGCLSH